MVEDIIKSKKDIQLINEINVEDLVNYIANKMNNGATYIDCIVTYAEDFNIDIEVVGEIVRDSPILLAAVHEEAEDLNLIEKITRLPV